MKKPFVPDINKYSDILVFMNDFFDLNKKKNPNFSFRYLGARLKWSAPYLNDVFKGRKKLSLNRALTFINFLGLSGLKAERFLFLYLADTDNAFSVSKLNVDALSSRETVVVKPEEELMNLKDFERLYLLDYYIIQFLGLHDMVWDPQLFLKRLRLAQKPTLETLEKHLNHLVRDQYLSYKKETNKYEVLPNFFNHHQLFDQSGAVTNEQEQKRLNIVKDHEQEYATQYLNSIHAPGISNRTFYSGIINLDEEAMKDVVERISSLRNHLYNLDMRTYEKFQAEPPQPKDSLYQFSLNIFSIFRTDDEISSQNN